MFLGMSPVLLASLSFLWASTQGDIHCDLNESCILPCRFQASDEEVIHWIQEKPISASAHSYYYKKNQLTLQDQRFKGRTSLFLDKLTQGNASLQLNEVEVQDEGRYKCYTSTISGHDQSYVQLNVDAPVHKVNIDRKGNTITCNSEGIYPEPKLTWSTEPPSVSLNGDYNTVQIEQKLYIISSSLNLTNEDLNVSCTVQTRKNKRKTTLTKTTIQSSENDTNLSCTLPAAPRTNLIWRFKHDEEILSQKSNEKVVVSKKWEKHFVDLSAFGSLKLKDLTSDQAGRYICEASNSEETLRSDTLLTIEKPQETSHGNTRAIVGVVCGALLCCIVACVFFVLYKRRAKKSANNGVV